MNSSIQSSPCPECGGTGRKGFPPQWVPCSACQGTSPSEDPVASNRWLFVFLTITLTGTFLWRAIGVADEIPSPGYRALTIGLDLLCLVSLIGLRIHASRQVPPLTFGLNILFWFALLAGLGLFAIRLSSPRSWETGHLKYIWDLSPRSDVRVSPVIPAAKTAANDTKTGLNTVESVAPDSPSAVSKAYYAAIKNKDIQTMKTLLSKDTFSSIYANMHDKKAADEAIDKALRMDVERPLAPSDDTRNEKITGNTATVECLSSKGDWYTQNFVNEDGKWKLKAL